MIDLKFKKLLHEKCLQNLQKNIVELNEEIASVIASRNNEEKSSAGDKYETGRATIQQEIDRLSSQRKSN